MLLQVLAYILLSLSLLPLGDWIARRSRTAGILTALSCVGLLLLTAFVLIDNPRWIKYLPITEVWLWSNPALPAAVLLSAVTWRLLPPVLWQRLLLCAVVLALGVDRSLGVLYRTPALIGPERWTGAVCRQTTKSTCGPAAVATALAKISINTSEAAMSSAALTYYAGTSNLGVYRALRVALAGTDHHVKLFEGDPKDVHEFPAVVMMKGVKGSPILAAGDSHAIALLGRRSDGRFAVGDPFAGLTWVTDDQLRLYWTGTAYIIEK